jgi:hypothetical protein
MAKRVIQEPYFIYPGERRPVIVQAKNKRHAIHKVQESPEYDGFPPYVFTIEDFNKRCLSSVKVAEPVEKIDKVYKVDEVDIALFIAVKSVEGAVNEVFVAPTKGMIVSEADKLGRHLCPGIDSLVVYKIPMPDDLDSAESPKEPIRASFFYKPPLGKNPKVADAALVDGRIQKEIK